MPETDSVSTVSTSNPSKEDLLRQQEEILRRRGERGWQHPVRVLVADEARELRWSQERWGGGQER